MRRFDYPLLSDAHNGRRPPGVKRGLLALMPVATFVIDTDRKVLDVISSEFSMDDADKALATCCGNQDSIWRENHRLRTGSSRDDGQETGKRNTRCTRPADRGGTCQHADHNREHQHQLSGTEAKLQRATEPQGSKGDGRMVSPILAIRGTVRQIGGWSVAACAGPRGPPQVSPATAPVWR